MKRGQLLSQPFFYIFAIVVIGLTMFFGYYVINKLTGTACLVENQQFIADLKSSIEEVYSVGFQGSSKKCAIVTRKGSSDLDCEFLMPSGIKGMCFVEATETLDYSGIDIKEIREELEALAGEKDRNLFFLADNLDCMTDSQKIKKVSIPEQFCVSKGLNPVNILIENTGNEVVIKEV